MTEKEKFKSAVETKKENCVCEINHLHSSVWNSDTTKKNYISHKSLGSESSPCLWLVRK